MGIDWDEMLAGDFIKLSEGITKVMVVHGWKPQEKFKDDKTGEIRKGLEFQVTQEDDKKFDEESQKVWTVTAIGALVKLRPIIEKAESDGKTSIKISVVRVGEGRKTEYSIKEVE